MKIHTISLLFKLHLKENCERIWVFYRHFHSMHAKKLEVKHLDARLSYYHHDRFIFPAHTEIMYEEKCT